MDRQIYLRAYPQTSEYAIVYKMFECENALKIISTF